MFSLSFKLILQQRLSEAVGSDTRSAIGYATPKANAPGEVPFRRSLKNNRPSYCTSIAFKLAGKPSGGNTLKVANQVASSLQNQPDFSFAIQVVPPGLIEFQPSDLAIASWLQFLLQLPASIPNELTSSSNFFSLQYTHARCCSLLRLAHREKLINWGDSPLRLIAPNPIPWLNETANLRLIHPAEQELILQYLGILDALDSSSQPNYLKLGEGLSRAFETFYSQCRIWGEVKRQDPQLSQARLGLVAVTQTIMRSLLQDYLCISPLLEL